MPFTLARQPLANGPRLLVVQTVEDLTPGYRRITLAGDLAGFASLGADDHMRIFFVPAGFEPGEGPEGMAAMREHPSREYTPVAWTDTTLTYDFVIHGDGPASTWAASAAIGDRVAVGGPRGSMVVEGEPDWWLLGGDRTALPAIRRFLAGIPAGVPVDVVLLAEDPADEQAVETAGELALRWVRDLDALVAALAATPARPGEGFVFLAAESAIVKAGRELLAARGIPLEHATVRGYWKRGVAEYHDPR